MKEERVMNLWKGVDDGCNRPDGLVIRQSRLCHTQRGGWRWGGSREEALDVRVRNSSAKVGNNKNLATMDGERPRVWENRLAFGGSDVPPNMGLFRGVKTP
jgi:hypothetical protein